MDTGQLHAISRALSDPTRFAIFCRIGSEAECSCAALNVQFRVSQATISHHLRELHEAGLITGRRQAKFLFLRVNRGVWKDYLQALRQAIPTAGRE